MNRMDRKENGAGRRQVPAPVDTGTRSGSMKTATGRVAMGWHAGVCTRLLAGLVLAGAVSPVLAQGLSVDVEGADGHGLALRVVNTSAGRVDGLRIGAAPGAALTCDGISRQGLSVPPGGSLQSGDELPCRLSADSGSLVVAGRARGGSVHVRPLTLSGRGVITPDQGFVVLIAGGVHADSDLDGRLDAGEVIDYHYTVLNVGTLALSGLAVNDIDGSVACPQTTLAVGGHMVCTGTHVITPAEAAAGEVLNGVEVNGTGSDGGPVQGGDVVLHLDLQARAGIRVFKSPLLLDDPDGNGFVSPGDTILYTFVIKNDNAETLSGVDLVELAPALVNGPIACEAVTLSGQGFAGLGSGQLQSQDTLLCTASYTVQDADAAAGQILNVVEARGQAAIAGPVQGTGASLLLLPGQSALHLSKSVQPPRYVPGGTLTFTIEVRNAGTLPLNDVVVSDPLPTGITGFSWTCAGTYCPNANGTGPINETIPLLPIGEVLVYTVTAQVAANPPPTIHNEVTASPSTLVSCMPAGTPAPCNADTEAQLNYNVMPAPVGGPWVMLLLALGVLVLAWRLRP